MTWDVSEMMAVTVKLQRVFTDDTGLYNSNIKMCSAVGPCGSMCNESIEVTQDRFYSLETSPAECAHDGADRVLKKWCGWKSVNDGNLGQ